MPMSPRVSVIIPAYNASASIGETLDSVIAQTYSDWEVIVADDCSTDGTVNIVSDYHPRVSCVSSEHNRGPAAARNLALTVASGELVALLDADDLWRPLYLQRQLAHYDAAIREGTDVGIVCCGAVLLGPHGLGECAYPKRSVTLARLLRANSIHVSSIVPRGLIEELGGFATDCFGTEDYDMWLRILESGRAVVPVMEPLAVYRIGSGTVSSNVEGMARAMQVAYGRALERGQLSRRERMIVRRELRRHRMVELRETLKGQRVQTGHLPLGELVRALPLGVHVALERPDMWLPGLRLAVVALRDAVSKGRVRAG
jgi:glycosyltransferase involved in cell wall biosynthesis